MMKKLLFLILLALPLLPLFAQTFTEVALTSGVSSTYGNGNHGGGVSFADFNGDGLDDLTFTSANGLPVYFYRNNGNGTFTTLNLINNTQESKEAIWADYDNDGDQDLFLTVHNGANRLYRNEGGLNMTDVTMSAFGYLDNLQTFGAAWGDFDRDGWLDLYVCEYIESGSENNKLFRNNGDGTFEDISAGTACNDGPKLTFDACFIDSNLDLWPDIYVANDKFYMANALYVNQLGTYVHAAGSGANIVIDAMNAGGGDYDNDGDFDLYVSNSETGCQLLQNDGFGGYSDVAAATGTGIYRFNWSSNFFDYDNDLDQDLYVSCLKFVSQGWANSFLINEGDGTFSDNLAATGGLSGTDTGNSFGHAMGDINNDGKLDIAVCQEMDNNLLWRNDETTVGNYLRVRLAGTTSNRDGIGARVVVTVGPNQLTRWRHGSQGYLSQHSQSLHFGLGNNTQIDNIQVFWPSGIVDSYDNVTSINQLIGLTEGETVLPLTLIDFQAKPAGLHNQLNWVTGLEINTSHFAVESSIDGSNFYNIGRVLATGDSQNELTYGFLDRNVDTQATYYRLKMTDLDGSFSYSEIRLVKRDGSDLKDLFSLGANPAGPGTINVTLAPDAPVGDYRLSLYDVTGKIVRYGHLASGSLILAGGLTAGSYTVVVTGNGHRQSRRLIVQ
ncbi:hypothetical protein CEQ90_03990 [Lewinellaceae bacterium SD302]|nr:hypothetical protein CEQ90_03990 [Lewinellaceae bacterium SD302]